MPPPTRFIISFAEADRDWARWIAFQLQRAGAETHLDYEPGSNEVVEFEAMFDRGDRVLAVLSPASVADSRLAGIWAAALRADQDGQDRRLVPVVVVPCEAGVLLDAVTPVRLDGVVGAGNAADHLMRALGLRPPDSAEPGYPGATVEEARSIGRVDELINEPPDPGSRRRLVSTGDSLPRLRYLSEQATAEVGQVTNTRRTTGGRNDFASGLYVRRDVEPRVRGWLSSGLLSPVVVVGAPGSGKSSLLWGVATSLLADGHEEVFLIKAIWLREKSADGKPIVNHGMVSSAMRAAADAGLSSTIIVDTVDLIVHDAAASLELMAIVGAAQEHQAGVVVTTRPGEAQLLPASWERISLASYSTDPRDDGKPSEFERAVASHSATYCSTAQDAHTMAARLVSAVARWQPLGALCRRPLTMRMLYELYAPATISDSVDVTGLYQAFWADRVAQDRRVWGRRSRGPSVDRDLRSTAMWLALKMLESGSPEVSLSSGPSYDPVQSDRFVDDVDMLVERGVGEITTIAGEDVFRFFHQTFFEFAAAQALLDARGSEALFILEQRIRGRADDYFLLAVFEQTWLCAWQDDAMAAMAMEIAIRFLDEFIWQLAPRTEEVEVEEPFPYPLQRTILAVLAQSSNIPQVCRGKLGEVLRLAGLPVVRDCLALMPPPVRRWRDEDIEVLAQCVTRDDSAWVAVVNVLDRLAYRDPDLVMRAVVALRLTRRASEFGKDLGNHKELPRLLTRLLPVDPDAMLRQLRTLCAVAVDHDLLDSYVIDVLAMVADQAGVLPGVDFACWADEIITNASKLKQITILAYAELHRIQVGNLAATTGGWSLQLVELKSLLSGLESERRMSPMDCARLGGLLLAFARDAPLPTADVVVVLLRRVANPILHGEIRRGWLAGYAERGPNAMIDCWVDWLVDGLPASHNRQDSVAQRRADTVRRILESADVPLGFIAALADVVAGRIDLSYLSGDTPRELRPWLEPDVFLRFVIRGLVGGSPVARDAVLLIRQNPDVLGQAARVFLAQEVPPAASAGDLALVLEVLVRWGRRGELAKFLSHRGLPLEVSRSHTPQLLELVETGVASVRANEQRATAKLLHAAVVRGVLDFPEWTDLCGWLRAAREVALRATLVKVIGLGLEAGSYRPDAVRNELSVLCRTDSGGKLPEKADVLAARTVLVVLLAKWGVGPDSNELLRLAFLEPVDSATLAKVSSHVQREHRKAVPLSAGVAIDFLLEFGRWMKKASGRARKDTAIRWRAAMTEVVTGASERHQLDVVAAFEEMDQDFAASVVLQMEPWRHPEVQKRLNEVVRRPGLGDQLRRDIRLVLAEKTRHHVRYDWPELRGQLADRPSTSGSGRPHGARGSLWRG